MSFICFFFKQKTAYEMRISDWSSDVCSSDLPKKPARATLHGEIVTLRQVLKTANRKGWIAALPDMSAPYKTSGKVEHRAWFSPEEYKMLYEATRERAKNPPKPRWRERSEEHTSELQSLMRRSYAVFCLKNKRQKHI